jgi:sugar lactone lactonase YvrE
MVGTWVRRLTVLLLLAAPACGYEPSAPATYEQPAATANDGLWLASGSRSVASILRLSPAQLLTGGSISAATEINTASASLFAQNSIAFDATGTMWIASAEDSLMLAYPAKSLGASGLHAARAVILPTSRSLSAPSALAFDRQQRLWVSNFEAGTLVRFDPIQLAVSGRPVPRVIIEGLDHPAGIAFDASGALWVANSHAQTVVRYSARQLEVSGRVTPDVVLSAVGNSLWLPFALAFDASGSLWISNIGNGTMVEFTAAQLAATGSPVPRTTLMSSVQALGVPVALAFDAEGSLWSLGASGALGKFSKSDLRDGGSKAPAVSVEVRDHALLAGLAFYPTPRGLPLN